ncbi:Protein transport protein YIP1 [Tritrichomonas foetus]|uniref:Protein transport protein YIP1 n=1 Tax=Tritrichomonas foetus TaxID=1144522 RepID=A0A1J4JN39_9EUKA|nr:Protein transport protein YIP1 [Tritrichomonas foetus]|eukprot:OHT00106.1 Protein transport protein YIP1 [Tritrichomonas foetus]
MIGGDELGFLNVPAEEQLSGSMSSMKATPSSHSAESYASTNDFASIWHGGFPDEPSLFEEMGIHNTNVVNNLKVILLPMSEVRTVDDNFLVGMLFFCLFAGALLLLGKVRFGMVYMIGIFGFILLYYLFKFMSPSPLSMGSLFTALSYCTIPLAPFVLFVGIFRMRAKSMTICSIPFIAWSAYSATRYILTQLKLYESFYLILIPLFLFYAFLLLLPLY